jgi:tetratricopeptide (TPR) repeat protein
MKFSCAIFLIAGTALLGSAQGETLNSPPSPLTAQQLTPAQQRIEAAKQQIAADPKKAEAYNNLAVAFIRRARETASPDYDRQAAEAIATGLSLAPQDFQLRKAQVALLLDEHEFARAKEEAQDLNLHNPDDTMVYGYLARAEIGLGDYHGAEEATQWMLNMLPFNVPGLLIAADLRDIYGDPEGALDLLNRAYAETSPAETEELASIANRIASIEIDSGKLDAASKVLQRADELFPGYPETLKNRARISAAPQHPTEAAADSVPHVSAEPVNKKPEQPGLMSRQTAAPKLSPVSFAPVPAALLVPQPTGTERVIRTMQSRVQSHPKDPAAYSALGAAFFQRARETGDVEDFQLAEQSLNKSLDLVNQDFSADAALSTMAEVCMGEHRFNDAENYAQKALSLGSGDLSSFAIVGDANADMGDYERAAVAYSRLDISGDAASEPRNVYVRDSRTSYLKFISGDTPGAISLMQSAVAAGTEARLPAENLAWLYFELGEYEFQAGDAAAANAAYLTALNIHPGDYRALAGLGKLRGNQGRYTEAIKLYQSAIAVVPMPMYVADLGDLYSKAGNAAEAAKQYKLVEYIGLLGHINQVLHNRDLALFYADHDIKLDESLALAHKEFEVRHDIYTWDALAWALYKNSKYQEANDAINNALRPGTRDALLYFHAGMIASRMGQTTQARGLLEQALSINPQFHVIYAGAARQQLEMLQTQAGLTASQGQNHVP